MGKWQRDQARTREQAHCCANVTSLEIESDTVTLHTHTAAKCRMQSACIPVLATAQRSHQILDTVATLCAVPGS